MDRGRKQQRSLKVLKKKNIFQREELKFIVYILWKESLEKLSFTGHIDGERDRETQCVTDLTNLCEWICRTWGGKLGKEKNAVTVYKILDVVESHDRLHPEGTRHIEEFEDLSGIDKRNIL